MKLNTAERWLVNHPARALVQHFFEVPLLLRLGGSVQSGRVLEVGCGGGAGLSLLLSRFGAAYVEGVDLDPRQVACARKRLMRKDEGRVAVGVARVEQLPFEQASFDAVFDFGMLHHVPAWQAGIGEICRVLKPEGRFYFEEVTRAALNRWAYRTFLQHPRENRFSEAEFLEELTRNGLCPQLPTRRVLFGDIFVGVAKRG